MDQKRLLELAGMDTIAEDVDPVQRTLLNAKADIETVINLLDQEVLVPARSGGDVSGIKADLQKTVDELAKAAESR